MMGEVVNLNKARKTKGKAVARATAEANRAKFGRTKAEKIRDESEKARTDRATDGAKLEKE